MMGMVRTIAVTATILAVSILAAFVSAQAPQAVPAVGPTTFPALPDQAHLHNAHVVTAKVISGAQPDDEAAFAALAALGVKTIISVDGAKPDVETARKFGMRYVHLPIGYDGVSAERGREIAKAITDLPGPIYVHCHHGKHRSAAAVAVACVYNGTVDASRADSVLQTFGTGKNYIGLWKAAREARPLTEAELLGTQVEYVETAKIADFAEAMVGVDKHWDHVKQTKEAGWVVPADHPDLDPAHEALQTAEHLRESARLDATAEHPADFRKMLNDAERATTSLSEMLRAKPLDRAAVDGQYKLVADSCTACHKLYRD